MAAPTQQELQAFGGLINPFQRNTRGKTMEKDLKDAHKINSIESGIGDKIHDAANDGLPNHPSVKNYVTDELLAQISRRELANKKEYCFLWVLDQEGIKILWENVENELDVLDKEVKHTNITAAGLAFHGGELFVTEDNKIFVNNASDRYGDSERQHWTAVISYFQKTYSDYQIIDLRPNDI